MVGTRNRYPGPQHSRFRNLGWYTVQAQLVHCFPAFNTAPLQKRQEKQPAIVQKIAWDAQLRLSHRYRHLKSRGMNHNKICVAIARELSGFIWNIGQHVDVE